MIDVYGALYGHIDKFWPSRKKEGIKWIKGPVQESLPDFSVIKVSPDEPSEPWVYITHGAWEVETSTNYRTEFFIISPVDSLEVVENLAMIANYHADQVFGRLDVGRSIKIGRAWLRGATCDHFLVSLPYPYGPDFEMCHVRDDFHVKYLWLLPITDSESLFLKSHGLERLEERFDEVELNYLDCGRSSVV